MRDIANWRKSSRSNGHGAMCVEVGFGAGAVGTRDSKLGEGSPILAVAETRWTSFINAVKTGTFDR